VPSDEESAGAPLLPVRDAPLNATDPALKAAVFVALMVGNPVPTVYRHVAETATTQGRLTVLINCGEEVEASWFQYVEPMAPARIHCCRQWMR
jgi:hypothetical protein